MLYAAGKVISVYILSIGKNGRRVKTTEITRLLIWCKENQEKIIGDKQTVVFVYQIISNFITAKLWAYPESSIVLERL